MTEPAHTAVNPPAPRAGRKEWWGLALLVLPSTLLALDVTLLHLAVPHLNEALEPGSTQLLWIVDIYGFMIAGLLVTMGGLGDRIGRRRLLLMGSAAFGAASVAAAYATSAEMLIAARALLGIAGATLMPSTLALIGNMFRDPRQRGLAIGVWAAGFSAGIALGPVIGGLMLEHYWWGSVFLLAVPVMVLLLATAPFLLPEYRDTEAGRLDLISVGQSLAAILPTVYGVKEMAKHGVQFTPAAAIAVGAVFGGLFVRRQRHLPDPLVDLSLFRSRAFTVALGIMAFSAFSLGGAYLFITQYLQMVADLSPFQAGLRLLPAALLLVLSSVAAPILARRFRPGHVTAASLLLSALGYAIITQADAGPAGVTPVMIGFAVIYIGFGPMMALSIDLVVGSAPRQKAGAASALHETTSELGIAVGIAVLGSAGTALYRARVDTPTATPDGATEAARDSLPGALETAATLPADTAVDLLTSARDAFTSALHLTGAIGAAVVTAIAVLATVTLRHIPPTHDPDQTPADAPATPDPAVTR